MNVIIAGSRTIVEYDSLLAAIKFSGFNITKVLSGCAKGVDELGEKYAKENNIDLSLYPAEWDKYGKSAGFKRNQDMALQADAAIVLWDGYSKGSKHMINIMRSMQKPVYVLERKN